jgi:putative Holliday junction resolvase
MALSDPLKITAQPMDTLNISGNNELLYAKLTEIFNKLDIEKIVIGYPKHLNGDVSDTTKMVDDVINNIEDIIRSLGKDTAILKWDERLTTVMAHNTMKELGIKQKDKKLHADRLAAMYILEDYLRYIS